MTPTPIAIGLTLCDQVIIEEGTRKATLVGEFARVRVQSLPAPPQPFCVYCTLIDGEGEGVIELVIVNMETDEEIHAVHDRIRIPDRLREYRVVFRIRQLSFPAPGKYEVALLIDKAPIAQRRIEVYVEAP